MFKHYELNLLKIDYNQICFRYKFASVLKEHWYRKMIMKLLCSRFFKILLKKEKKENRKKRITICM